MKKRLTIMLGILLCAFFLFMSLPRPIVKDLDGFKIYRVVHYDNDGDGKEITQKMDITGLREIIANYECSRWRTSFQPYKQKDVSYEVVGIYEGRPIHIFLGELSVVYEIADEGGYRIRNSGALLEEISSFIQP